jgi:hypothetical protein
MLAVVGGLLEGKAFEEGEVARLQKAVAGYLGPVDQLLKSGPSLALSWPTGPWIKAKVGSRSPVVGITSVCMLRGMLETHLPARVRAAQVLQYRVKLCGTLLSIPLSALMPGPPAAGAGAGAAERGPAAGFRERHLRPGCTLGQESAQT